ncbi:replication initiation protein [Vibrio breoganii]|uniref:replication initiation protein n=1 Tax=Vibrio breoganii TaxID=553239 RepID=UPI001F531422|nr:replication initiation protein [Vibrio breoganii]
MTDDFEPAMIEDVEITEINMDEPNHYPVTSDNLPKHIKKGHQLVFSRQDLSARESDLFGAMMAHMKPEDWKGNPPAYQFTAKQLSDWLGIGIRHIGSNLRPVAERLSNRSVGVKDNSDDEFKYRSLFSEIEYKNGLLTMTPNYKLKAEYIEYQNGFALINTKNYFEVDREYPKRLYEILSRFKSQGFGLNEQSLDDLKGYFGLLDEKGRLHKNKRSYAKNSVFMSRCIRDSIDYLAEHPEIKKELLFFKGSQGNFGFEVVKKGRTISGIKFLFRWIGSGTVDELNQNDALKRIKKLELKRLQNGVRLTISELKELATAYSYCGETDKSLKIENAIIQREKEEKDTATSKKVNEELQGLLAKFDEMESVSGNPDY